jgi:hypothetical protein
MVPYVVIVAPPGFKPCFYMPEGRMASAWKMQVEVLQPSLYFLAEPFNKV